METSTLLGDTSVINVVPPNQEMQDLDLEVKDDPVSLLNMCFTANAEHKIRNCSKNV